MLRYGLLGWIGSWFRSEEEVNLDLASAAKGAQLLSDEDIMVEYLGFSRNEAKAAAARMRIQKLEDVKLQMLCYNPGLGGIAVPQEACCGRPPKCESMYGQDDVVPA